MTSKKKRGLGRGLGALIPEFKPDFEKTEEVKQPYNMLHNSVLESNPYQPRTKFDEEKLEELSLSIKEHGILQPVLVRPNPSKEDHYQIIAGERRFIASKMAGLDNIPVIVKKFTDEEMLQIAIVENVQRDDLNPVEVSKSYARLINEFSYTQEKISEVVGRSRSSVANSLRLLKLPENILSALYDELITGGHAKALLSSKDEDVLNRAFFEILDKKLSVREAERIVRRLNEHDIHIRKDRSDVIPEFSSFEAKLESFFDAKVKILSKGEKGKIEILFKSKEELEKIISTIKS